MAGRRREQLEALGITEPAYLAEALAPKSRMGVESYPQLSLGRLLAEDARRKAEYEEAHPSRTHKFMDALSTLVDFAEPGGLGASDIGRAGVFATRHMGMKLGGKEARDAAARELRRDPLWKKGTRSGDILRRYVYQPEPQLGLVIEDRAPNMFSRGSVDVRDAEGMMFKDPTISVPTFPGVEGGRQYTPGSLGKVMAHERKHFELSKLEEDLNDAMRRAVLGGKPLSAEERDAIAFVRDWKRAAEKTPYRPWGHPIRTATEESEVGLRGEVIPRLTRQDVEASMADRLAEGPPPSLEQIQRQRRLSGQRIPGVPYPHGPQEAAADLGAVLGDVDVERHVSPEALAIMRRWMEQADPWRAREPGSLADVVETIEGIRRR